MQEGFSTCETWPFECLRCLLVWEEEYLVRRMSDGHGNDVVVWTRGGTPVQPPWSGMTCPSCGCGSVTTFPTGYLRHHAEVAHRGEAAVPVPIASAMAVPAPPSPDGPASARLASGTSTSTAAHPPEA